jgi:hypothetical protein
MSALDAGGKCPGDFEIGDVSDIDLVEKTKAGVRLAAMGQS